MPAPPWARLERQILAASVPACREFFQKYYDDRGYLQAFLRWGANDGPDDAFENFNRWPELHALGADDEILRLYLKAWEGMTRQYSEARTRDVPAGRDGMYVKDFSAQSDWMHHGEGLQLFNRMALSAPDHPAYRERAPPLRRALHGRGSRGPELRPEAQADSLDDQRQQGPAAAQGDGARLGRRSLRRHGFRRPPRREQLRAVPRALPGIHRRHRRPLPQPGRDDAADQRLPADRRGEVSPLDRRVHGRVARAHARERRDHPELRRPRRPDRRARGPVVGERLRLGVQSGQPGDRPPRGSQSHPARAGRLQQRAAGDRRPQVRRRLART